ncbi:Bug family tripartite tricarboxylate transporter substrate binding protein [Humitalea sp. 24SJ18S-53]|uniref:Bug family tripartite tricarboxylate transporter substrate binding protein n=1 Tax=Humitalea sp. 24SJ18S-53 TaxID=3422307 RepID=UPI003D66AD02
MNGIGRRAALAGLALPGVALAQTPWPDRTMRWIVGYPAGGASDLFARLIAAQMAPALGQNVVVENRPGGGAVLASDAVARSPADGNTWLHVDNGVLVYNPALYTRLPYDPDRDLTGVGFIGRFPLFLVVRADSPVRDFAGLVAQGRVRPVTYGTPAVASPHHLAMELVQRRAGLAAEHVPYRGAAAAMQDLRAGRVEVLVAATGLPFLRDPELRVLAVLSDARSASAPEVPTLRDLGIDAVAYGWQGMSVPAATPPVIIARLNAAMRTAVASDDITRRMQEMGVEPAAWSPAEFNAFVAAESALWRPLIRDLGIRLDS